MDLNAKLEEYSQALLDDEHGHNVPYKAPGIQAEILAAFASLEDQVTDTEEELDQWRDNTDKIDYSDLDWTEGEPPEKFPKRKDSMRFGERLFVGMVIVTAEKDKEEFYLVGDINESRGLCECCSMDERALRWAWLPGFGYPELVE